MKVIYSLEKRPYDALHSVFLAGPTPRGKQEVSWRSAALYYFQYFKFEGQVFVPEPLPGKSWDWDYAEQVEWEEEYLRIATKILFWIPRTLDKMPGFTTNIEFGRWCDSGKLVVGWPSDAVKMRYIEHYVKKLEIPSAHTLVQTVKLSLSGE